MSTTFPGKAFKCSVRITPVSVLLQRQKCMYTTWHNYSFSMLYTFIWLSTKKTFWIVFKHLHQHDDYNFISPKVLMRTLYINTKCIFCLCLLCYLAKIFFSIATTNFFRFYTFQGLCDFTSNSKCWIWFSIYKQQFRKTHLTIPHC